MGGRKSTFLVVLEISPVKLNLFELDLIKIGTAKKFDLSLT
jgi:hypothetical protein